MESHLLIQLKSHNHTALPAGMAKLGLLEIGSHARAAWQIWS